MKRLWVWLTHYLVVVQWEGVTKHHYAKSIGEVREWIDCYPNGRAVYGIRGKQIGQVRWGTADEVFGL